MATLATIGEDEDDDGDAKLNEDPSLITDANVAKQRIRQLTYERTRKQDYQRKLTRKLQMLDADLASRREEVEGLQRSLQLERNKFTEEHISLKRERDSKARATEDRIRDCLTEVLYAKPQGNGKQVSDLDTVLVSFVKPNESFRYNLAFRIDEQTTINQLRGSACKYWGVSPDLFILRTMANSKCQDDNRVKECFKQGEIAQLRLEMKKTQSAEPPLEEELKAIQPKDAKSKTRNKGKVRFNAEGVDTIQKFGDNYSSQLWKMGGIYFLLKLRDTKPSEHAAKIKLRDIIIYTALVALTFCVYNARRPPGAPFWAVQGVQGYMLQPTAKEPGVLSCNSEAARGRCVPSFEDVRSHDEVWDWLNFTIPAVFWKDVPSDVHAHGLSFYNTMLGYVSIRVQNTRPPTSLDELCTNNGKLVKSLPGAACFPETVNDDTQRSTPFPAIVSYWKDVTKQVSGDPNSVVRGRSNPGEWVDAKTNQGDHGIGTTTGLMAYYDASGYGVDYRMTVTNPVNSTARFKRDLQVFRDSGWISHASRAVIISFGTYNFQYDLWTASDFVFELPASGDVLPTYSIRPYRPRIYETPDELTETYLDYGRTCIAIYILLFVGFLERQNKVRNHKAGFYYHISLTGITDLGMVACILCATSWRISVFQSVATGVTLDRAQDINRVNGFYCFSDMATAYNNIFIVDGFMMAFVMYRLISFFRLSHTIYILWHTLGEALKALLFFVGMFMPAMAGVVVISNLFFGSTMPDYALISGAAVQVYFCIIGQIPAQLLENEPWMAFFVAVALYLFVTFALLNIFASIVVDAYYMVQMTSVNPPEKWDAKKLAQWAIPGMFVQISSALFSSQGGSEHRDQV